MKRNVFTCIVGLSGVLIFVVMLLFNNVFLDEQLGVTLNNLGISLVGLFSIIYFRGIVDLAAQRNDGSKLNLNAGVKVQTDVKS